MFAWETLYLFTFLLKYYVMLQAIISIGAPGCCEWSVTGAPDPQFKPTMGSTQFRKANTRYVDGRKCIEETKRKSYITMLWSHAASHLCVVCVLGLHILTLHKHFTRLSNCEPLLSFSEGLLVCPHYGRPSSLPNGVQRGGGKRGGSLVQSKGSIYEVGMQLKKRI